MITKDLTKIVFEYELSKELSPIQKKYLRRLILGVLDLLCIERPSPFNPFHFTVLGMLESEADGLMDIITLTAVAVFFAEVGGGWRLVK